MSLLNDALKRVPQAQPKRMPGHAPDRPLEPAALPEARSKGADFCVGLVALASLAAGLCMNPWWRSGQETARRAGSSPAAPTPVLTTVAAQSSAGAPPTGAIVPADAFVSTAVKESAPSGLELNRAAAAPPPTTPAPTKESGASRSDTPDLGVYVVRTGDTLTRIAKRHGTSVKALRAVNTFKGDRIAVGQKIRVPATPATRTTAES